jgi:hypothetical protein
VRRALLVRNLAETIFRVGVPDMNVSEHELRIEGRILKLAALAADTYEFVHNPESVIRELQRCKQHVDLFTFIQPLPDTAPKHSYYFEWDNLAVIPVTTFDDWWMNQIGFKARNKAKQAEKRGIRLREVPFSDELVQGIWAIYNESAVRQGKRFPHFGKDLATVHSMTETFLDRSCFIGAYFEDRLIGFVKLHCDRARTQAGLTHILSLIEHRDKAPTNALLAESVRYCAKQRIPYLVYSRFSDGGKTRDTLMDFKERNGFKRVDVPRYFVPITPMGSAALRLGLHRGLSEHLPQSAVAACRWFRKAWYSRTANRRRQLTSNALNCERDEYFQSGPQQANHR